MRFLGLLFGVLLFVPLAAYADDQLNPLAASGDWMAFSHSPSLEDPPDICLAISVPEYGLALRVDNQGSMDLRFSDSSWSLPANVSGNIKAFVNGHSYNYAIQGNSSTTVDAPLTQDQLVSLVADMETSASMQIIAGTASPKAVPLDGSKTALTAFMTCAGISNPSNNTGGNNPFSSQ